MLLDVYRMVYGGLPYSGWRAITMLIRLPFVPFQIAFFCESRFSRYSITPIHTETTPHFSGLQVFLTSYVINEGRLSK